MLCLLRCIFAHGHAHGHAHRRPLTSSSAGTLQLGAHIFALRMHLRRYVVGLRRLQGCRLEEARGGVAWRGVGGELQVDPLVPVAHDVLSAREQVWQCGARGRFAVENHGGTLMADGFGRRDGSLDEDSRLLSCYCTQWIHVRKWRRSECRASR